MAVVFAILYERKGDQWDVLNEGWAEVHLYKDSADGTFRIIAWSSNSEDVLINSNVTHKSKYAKKAADFHKYVDDAGKIWGFGFYHDENSANKAKDFLAAMQEAIQMMVSVSGSSPQGTIKSRVMNKPKVGSPPPASNMYNSIRNPEPKFNLPLTSQIFQQQAQKSSSDLIGPLPIGAPKPLKTTVAKPLPIKISEPIKVVRERHVAFDETSKQFVGLPEEWKEKIIGHHFGIPLKHVRCVQVPGYESSIPQILVQMKEYLQDNGAYHTVGIFRLAPDAILCRAVKDELDRGVFTGCQDVNCVANCVKIFFRDLPRALLGSVDIEVMSKVETADQAASAIAAFPEPDKSVLLWLLDLCAEVTSHSQVNKMTPQNLAICIAPNLFVIRNQDPLASVVVSQKIVQFMYNGILWRSASK